MKPIPETATLDDPLWQAALHDLARALIEEGAKAKLIERFTGCTHAQVARLYRAVRGANPPSGPVQFGSPQLFVNARASQRMSGPAWNLQVSLFLRCYLRLRRLISVRANRGWMLVTAYRSYLAMTDALAAAEDIPRLEINQAFAALYHAGISTATSPPEMALRECKECAVTYLILTGKDLDRQRCPVCVMEQNHDRLVRQSAQLREPAHS